MEIELMEASQAYKKSMEIRRKNNIFKKEQKKIEELIEEGVSKINHQVERGGTFTSLLIGGMDLHFQKESIDEIKDTFLAKYYKVKIIDGPGRGGKTLVISWKHFI